MRLCERLFRLVHELENGNRGAFADKLGINRPTFLSYLTEDGEKRFRVVQLIDLATAYPQVNVRWLLTGEGEPLMEGYEPPAPPSDEPKVGTPVADAVRTAETALRQAGATDAVVWQTVMGLAKVNADKEE